MITVIFDMDGTLINSANAIVSAVNEIRKDMGFQPLDANYILHIINTPGKDWAQELYNIKDFKHNSFKNGFEKYFVKHYQQSVILYDGIKELLEELKNKKAYLAIATNAPQESLPLILKKYEISTYFDEIIGVSDNIEPKPNPAMLNLIKSKSPYTDIVFVGDSKKDEEAAKNANIPYLSAKWGRGSEKDNEFGDKNELKSKIEELFNINL